jgi:hypothetical protein
MKFQIKTLPTPPSVALRLWKVVLLAVSGQSRAVLNLVRFCTLVTHTMAEQTEIDKNYEAFRQKLPERFITQARKCALMREREIVEFF